MNIIYGMSRMSRIDISIEMQSRFVVTRSWGREKRGETADGCKASFWGLMKMLWDERALMNKLKATALHTKRVTITACELYLHFLVVYLSNLYQRIPFNGHSTLF